MPDHWRNCHLCDDGYENGSGEITVVSQTGFVHTGRRSVALKGNACMYQTVRCIGEGCCYIFQFCAKSDNCAAGLTAEVLFETRHSSVKAAVIVIRKGDMNTQCAGFGHYDVIVGEAPCDIVSATVRFMAENEDHSHVYIDDVSLRAV